MLLPVWAEKPLMRVLVQVITKTVQTTPDYKCNGHVPCLKECCHDFMLTQYVHATTVPIYSSSGHFQTASVSRAGC